MKIALTGATGNMGIQAVRELIKLPDAELRMLVFKGEKRIREIKKICKNHRNRIEFVYGNLADANACAQLIKDTDYVVNMAAVIPPHSDQHPELAIECNERGVDTLVSAIENAYPQPKLIHVSTVALYGNRNEKHLWGRVGDPLLVSPFDIYSLTKLRGEFRVLESEIQYKTVLRQTAVLHSHMLADNMNDGLMFHTCFNAPLEWVTAEDSGLLIANIIKRDAVDTGELEEQFWNKCFNIGGGLVNCVTGYEVLNDGFEIIGGSVKDFFDPDFNATRNFHGVWFADSNVLDDMFHYQRQSTADFWEQFKREHGIMKAGKIVPKKWLKKLAIERLFKSKNAVRYWYKHDDEAKMIAYFGGVKNYEEIGKDWTKFALLRDSSDYATLLKSESAQMLEIGYDTMRRATLQDLARIALLHGGKLLSTRGNVNSTLEWENSDGVRFTAKGYTVLCGHWINPCYGRKYYPNLPEYCWDFDRLAKGDGIYAQLWYDSHDVSEDNFYYYDENFNAKYRKIR